MNPLLISALLSAAVSFGAAWQIQGWRMDSYKSEVVNEQLSRERSSRQALADAQAAVQAAQDAAKAATARVRRDIDGARTADVGMRDALANAVRSAHTDLQTCGRQVDALGELLTASTDLSRRMAAEADEWAVHGVTLQEAWPK